MQRILALSGLVVLAVTWGLSGTAVAQDSVQNAPDRTGVMLAIGDDVTVATRAGRTYRGRLLLVTTQDILLSRRGGEIRVPWADITRATAKQSGISIGKSALIGLGIGVGVGAIAFPAGACTEDAGTFAIECLGFIAGIGAGAGALTGLAINASRPSRTIYRGDGRQLVLAPVVARDRAGVLGVITW